MKKLFIIIIIFVFGFSPIFSSAAFFDQVAGRILLQVEDNGEAWYVNPVSLERHYLGRPQDSWQLMRSEGIGISDSDLERIPVGLIESNQLDSDGDGLSDSLENALGLDITKKDTDGDGFSDYGEIVNRYNPRGSGVWPIDSGFINKHLGKIFLQVEKNGEAWYLNPVDNQRYYLGRPVDAWHLMREFGLGASNQTLSQIAIVGSERVVSLPRPRIVKSESEFFDLREIESLILERINQERVRQGLGSLEWNQDLSYIAREHSVNLANENKSFTGIGVSCDYPLIHHEGLDFGLYNIDRLTNRGVYYYSKAGENIALASGVEVIVRLEALDAVIAEIDACPGIRDSWDDEVKTKVEAATDSEKANILRKEIKRRAQAFQSSQELEIASSQWLNEETAVETIVESWLGSPGHRANIMEGDYNETGLGLAYVNGYLLATQIFIKRVNCGFLNGACCSETGYFPYCFIPNECVNNICQNY